MNDDHQVNVDVKRPASYRYGERLPADSAMLEELLKETDIQQLFESYYNLINIPVAIIDLDANVLFSSRWQRICTEFHRVHPTTCERCLESDRHLAALLREGKTYAIYACRNHLTDCAAPIIIEGKHIANVFVGQFFTVRPDEGLFRLQAEEFGFDVSDYLAALHEVPIVEAERIPVIVELLLRATRLITNLAIDRKRASESQARQSVILDTIPQSVFWKDTQGRYLGCNARFARSAGLATPDDIVGKTDFDLPWPRQDAEAYRADDLAVISAKQPKLHFEEPLQKADGSRIVVDTSKIPLVDAGNTAYGIVGIYEDITERKQVEEKAKASEEKFRKAFMTGADAFYLATFHDGKIAEVNDSFADVFGYTREEAIGKTSIELGLYADPIDRQKWVSEMEATGYIRNLKLRSRRKGGQLITVLLSVSLLKGVDDELILGVVKDITEQIRSQDALVESESRFRALSEDSVVGIYIVQDGRFSYVNKAMAGKFGYDPAELIGGDPLNLIVPEDRAYAGENMRRRLAGEDVPSHYEFRARTKDGETRYIEIYGALSVLNNRPAIIGSLVDITERLRNANERRKANEDLRNSLVATIGAIAATVASRDPYTAGHQRRVAELAAAIAGEMGLESSAVEGIRFGALIHDLGKVRVPAGILVKPSQLSMAEFELIKEHPQAGYEIVKDIRFPWPVAAMIHQHHERLDGSGYPQGLKRDEIALEARILAVADVVEAMASHRPYRASLGIEVALQKIEEKRGQWFDSRVVEACVRLFREARFSFESTSQS
ncbi:MAG: PAS domain S-box protein [Betaproteobacteria bacterium]|nr:PAS domain S-box protein [Betaproteobacteria bacterium]